MPSTHTFPFVKVRVTCGALASGRTEAPSIVCWFLGLQSDKDRAFFTCPYTALRRCSGPPTSGVFRELETTDFSSN